MPRSASAGGLTVGFMGTGPIAEEDQEIYIGTQLDEFLAARATVNETKVKFIAPIGLEYLTDEIGQVLNYAIDHEIPFEVITIPGEKLPRTSSKYSTAATKNHVLENPEVGIVNLLEDAPAPRLLLFWDSELVDDMERLASMAMEVGIKVHDLLDNNVLLTDAEEGGEDTDLVTYSREDLDAMDRASLTEVAKRVGIEKLPRATAAAIEAILDAQPSETEDPNADPDDSDAGALDDGEETVLDLEGSLEGLREDLDAIFSDMGTRLTDAFAAAFQRAVGAEMEEETEEAPEELPEAPEPPAAPRRGRGRPPGSKNKPKEPEPTAAAPTTSVRRRRVPPS